MSATISSIHYCPVKSISYQSVENCNINKNIGLVADRIFAFAKDLNLNEANLFEQNPEYRKGKWNKILTLKNTPVLNKYNFLLNKNELILIFNDKKILTIDSNQSNERQKLSDKITELEKTINNKIILMKNESFPFYDTSISKKVDFVNSISLLNTESIKDFEKKIDKKIERSIFRGNVCIEGVEAWKEREWIGKTLKINNVSFKVEKNIPRCVAINLKPKSDDNSFNLLKILKQTFNHFDMGIYLTPLEDGEINLLDKIEIN